MLARLLPVILLFSVLSGSFAQSHDSDRTVQYKGVTVSAYRETADDKASLNISEIQTDSWTNAAAYNLSEMLALVPGVSNLSTGNGIAKPVIRGLYGNRVLVLVAGLKFDNQQWQEEHGLGMSYAGLSKVELIMGPMSVLYGSEAMGGVVNLVEEDKPKAGQHIADMSLKGFSNTMGGALSLGYRKNIGRAWFRIRLNAENNADYTDGNNKRVLNSRFDGYMLKSTYGFRRKGWISNNHFMSSFNRFGFIFNDVYRYIDSDARGSRDLSVNPAHMVILNMLNSENDIRLKKGRKLNLNAGLQSNRRMENEGGGAISLDMHLFTAQYLMKYEMPLGKKNDMVVSHMLVFEDNTNYGARKIVPDAKMFESNVSAYIESEIGKRLTLEYGAGAGIKRIRTFFTARLNGPDNEMKPFIKSAPYENIFLGALWRRDSLMYFKANVSTGVRMANLAELSSDGLHEGVFTYELGNPNLKNEQNLALNILAHVQKGRFTAHFSPFYNRFFNYIYLSPTTEQWNGFPVFRYVQSHVTQYGLEAELDIRLHDRLNWHNAYFGMLSKRDDGTYTPYIPSEKLSSRLQYGFSKGKTRYSAMLGTDVYLRQTHLANAEIGAGQYTLLNAGISGSREIAGRLIAWSVQGKNLLNELYFDQMSRFKYFGIYNTGINFVFSLKIRLTKENH